MRAWRIGIEAGLACSARPTGVEYFARSLLQEVVRIEAREIEWYLYLPPGGDLGGASMPGVVVRRRPDFNTLLKTPWLVYQTRRDRLDALYTSSHRFPRGLGGRTVATVYDTAFDEYPDCYPPGEAERAHAEVAGACRRAARIAVPSEATRRGVVEGYGYPAGRVDLVYGASRDCFCPGPAGPLPERVAAAGVRSPFLLSVGRLDRRKNLERVIDAYRRTLGGGVESGGLVIVGPEDTGSPAVRERLQAGAVDGERIVTTGYLAEPELVSLYRAAAGVVYPSLAEGFGLPVLEAMACGAPVITSNLSSMREVAGDAALLADPTDTAAIADAMERVLTQDNSRLAAEGLKRARQFTWRASAERLAECLLRAAGENRDGS